MICDLLLIFIRCTTIIWWPLMLLSNWSRTFLIIVTTKRYHFSEKWCGWVCLQTLCFRKSWSVQRIRKAVNKANFTPCRRIWLVSMCIVIVRWPWSSATSEKPLMLFCHVWRSARKLYVIGPHLKEWLPIFLKHHTFKKANYNAFFRQKWDKSKKKKKIISFEVCQKCGLERKREGQSCSFCDAYM